MSFVYNQIPLDAMYHSVQGEAVQPQQKNIRVFRLPRREERRRAMIIAAGQKVSKEIGIGFIQFIGHFFHRPPYRNYFTSRLRLSRTDEPFDKLEGETRSV